MTYVLLVPFGTQWVSLGPLHTSGSLNIYYFVSSPRRRRSRLTLSFRSERRFEPFKFVFRGCRCHSCSGYRPNVVVEYEEIRNFVLRPSI